MKYWFLILIAASSLWAAPEQSETLRERSLRQLVERQKALFAQAEPGNPGSDKILLKSRLQALSSGFESFLRENPDFAAGYAAYGYFLHRIGMDKEAAAVLLKANALDPNIPLVKNELGNYLAEHGRPLEAVNYYLAAIQLAPDEPLYHYQLATLLHEAHDTFLKSGDWTDEALRRAMHEAFKKAADLAPDRIEFTYRYAESFYDMAEPDWPAALQAWEALEKKATAPVERQTMRLHQANVCLKMGRAEQARAILGTITVPELEKQRQKLVAQLATGRDK